MDVFGRCGMVEIFDKCWLFHSIDFKSKTLSKISVCCVLDSVLRSFMKQNTQVSMHVVWFAWFSFWIKSLLYSSANFIHVMTVLPHGMVKVFSLRVEAIVHEIEPHEAVPVDREEWEHAMLGPRLVHLSKPLIWCRLTRNLGSWKERESNIILQFMTQILNIHYIMMCMYIIHNSSHCVYVYCQ